MEKLISRKEAAKILGISVTALDQARSCGHITYVQYVENGCVYFTERALQNTLLAALIVQDLWIILQPTEREEYRNRPNMDRTRPGTC